MPLSVPILPSSRALLCSILPPPSLLYRSSFRRDVHCAVLRSNLNPPPFFFPSRSLPRSVLHSVIATCPFPFHPDSPPPLSSCRSSFVLIPRSVLSSVLSLPSLSPFSPPPFSILRSILIYCIVPFFLPPQPAMPFSVPSSPPCRSLFCPTSCHCSFRPGDASPFSSSFHLNPPRTVLRYTS